MANSAMPGRPPPAAALVWSARLPPDDGSDPIAAFAALPLGGDDGAGTAGLGGAWPAGLGFARAAAAPPPILVQPHPGGRAFDLVFDASVAAAPAGFERGLVAACTELADTFTNGITITLRIGWGEIDGTPLPRGVSEGGGTGLFYSYGQIAAALRANVSSADDLTALANLPGTDPTGGGRFLVFNAEAAALGLLRGDNGNLDGSIGFGAAIAYTFDPNDRAVPGELDFIGVAEHEITHAMGRSTGLDRSGYMPLDLFHYAGPGDLQLAAGRPAYFSIDGGKTDLNNFDTLSDPADWAIGTGNDAFDAESLIGAENPLTATDIRAMNVLGYDTSAAFFSGDSEAGVLLSDASRQNPATITAAGYVTNGGDGVLGAAGTAWTLTNFGTIVSAAGDGVHLLSGGAVTNAAGGSVSGAGNGVEIDGAAGTVVTAGRISGGGYAILFAGADALLAVEPGAVFAGAVVADGSGTVELAAGGNGVLRGLGSDVVGFDALTVDAGARWSLAGDAAAMQATNDGTIVIDAADTLALGPLRQDPGGHGVIRLGGAAEFTAGAVRGQILVFTNAAGLLQLDRPAAFFAHIAHFRAGDTIDLAGRAADALSFSGGRLSLTENGRRVATLSFAGAASEFVLATDGGGGTDLTLVPPAAAPFALRG